jgi:hypothetical protein
MKRQPLWDFPHYISDFNAAIPNEPKVAMATEVGNVIIFTGSFHPNQ